MKTYNVKLVLTEIKDNEKEEALTEIEIVEARDIAEAEKVMERILWNVHH
jgi:formiminotetrahydrofolate cyclodeaminase